MKIFVTLILAALAVVAPRALAQPKPEVVSVGVLRSVANAPLYVAEAKGYLAAEDVAIDTGNFRGAQDAVSSLATGQLEVALGAINAGFFNAASKGLDLRAVASLGIQPLPVTATPLIVRKDLWESGQIRTGKDLKGRKVAVNTPGASPEYFLSIILEKYGMTLKDVDETMIGFPEMLVALKNGGVDAALPAEPWATETIRQGYAVLARDEAGAGGGDMTTVVFFSGRFLRERTAVAERLLRAMVRAAHELKDGYTKDPEIAPILSKATGLSLESIATSIPYGFDPDLDVAKYVDSIRRQEQRHRKDGRLTYAEDLPLDRLVDASLVHEAAASLK